MFGIYAAGCAGGHLNPAVTFANCVFRKFPWRKWPAYACAQVAGCFCGAAVIYGNYKSAIDVYEGGPNIRTVSGKHPTAGVFCTYPQPFMSKTGQFFSEFIASSVLMFMIFALKDDSNLGAGNLTPLMLFFLIFGIGATLGWETGYAINLARDFGPRLFTYFIGYGHEVWSAGNYYFWYCFDVSFTAPTNSLQGSNDCTVLRLHIWRMAIRFPNLPWRKSCQHTVGRPETNSPTGLESRKGGIDGERSREGSSVICVINTDECFRPGCEGVTFRSKVTKIRTCLLFLLGAKV
jgi:MIP family channel proteins